MKTKIILPAFATLISSSLVAIITSSIAWFSNKISVTTEDNLTGSSDGAYFAYGTGTIADDPQTIIKEGPYGIETPRQLYNLAWLQYLGYFNKDKDENGVIDQQYYFELNANIDMTGWILPPIGTTLYPFIGNFNGRNFTITNLKISNNYQEILATNKMPSKVRAYETKALRDVNIVGMFGVIGELNDNITATYDNTIISVKDFTIAGAEIKNSMSETLAGIAAGYVNGPLKNVAITSRAGDVEHGESATMASRITTTGATNYDDYAKFTNISNYGVVGYCEPSFLDQVKNSVTETYNATSRTYDYIAQDTGDYSGWGGSIPMTDIFADLARYKTAAVQAGGIKYPTKRTVKYDESGQKTVDGYDTNSYVECTDMTGKEADYFSNYSSSAYNYYNYEQKDGDYVTSSYAFVNYSNNNFTCLTGERTASIKNAVTTTTTSYIDVVDTIFYFSLRVGGTTHYLTSTDGTTISDATNQGSASRWYYDGTYITLYNPSSETKEYLNNNNGTLSLGDTASSTWEYKSTGNNLGYFVTYNNNNGYFLYYESNKWVGKSSAISGYYITDGNGNYLSYDGSSYIPANRTSKEDATVWSRNNNGYFYTGNRYITYYSSNYKFIIYNSTNNIYTYDGQYLKVTVYSYSYEYQEYQATTYYVFYDGSKWDVSTTPYPLSILPNCNTTYSITCVGENTPPRKQETTSITREDAPLKLKPTFFPLKQINGVPEETNTGYLTSGGNYKVDQFGDIRFGRFAQTTYLPQKLNTIYTIEDDAGTSININNSRIISDTDRKKVFDKSKATMLENLGSNIDGLHFVDAPIKYGGSNSVFVDKVVINKNTFYNYELPQDCIDFNLKEKGYINFFAGSYFQNDTSGENNSFFTLHEIKRGNDPENLDNPKPILSIDEIAKIYSDGKEAHSYVYEYAKADASGNKFSIPFKFKIVDNVAVKVKLDDTPYTEYSRTNNLATGYNSTPVFNSSWIGINTLMMNNNRTTGFAYYFDIAMNGGEYALGSVPNGGVGAYLMYLDIGANAKKVYRSEIIEYFKLIDKVYSYPRGVFVCAAGTTNASDQNSYCICLKDSYTGTLIMDRTGSAENDEAKYSGSGDSSKESIAYMYPHLLLKDENNDTKKIDDVTADSTTTTEIKRLTYYDYNINDSTLNKIVITDVIINNDVAHKTRTVEKYSNFNIETQTGTADDELEIYIKNGDTTTKVTDPNTISFSTSGNTTKILSFTTSYVNGASITITFKLDVTGTENGGHNEYTPKGYTYTITLTRPDGTTEKITAYCYVKYYLNNDGTYTYTFKINDNSITGVSTTPIEITVPAIPQNNPQNP